MAVRVSRDQVFFAFGPGLTPAARVRQREKVILETHDCFQGRVRSERDFSAGLDWDHINPATGPIYIEGAQAGAVLRIDILDITLPERSLVAVIPGEGALGSGIGAAETVTLRKEARGLRFRDLLLPVHPMIGVIGIAPAHGEVPTSTAGPHGGNMDCTLIGPGSSLYLTVGVEGGLVGAGDLHATMGDGEIGVCGAETAGSVLFSAEVVPLPSLPTPLVETATTYAVIAAAETADAAAAEATKGMARFLTANVGLSGNEAVMLMSLVGQLRFCQIVDPLKTVRFEFPKALLRQRGFSLRGRKRRA